MKGYAVAKTSKDAVKNDDQKIPVKFRNWGPRHEDLRDWLERCEEIGELIKLKGVHWD